MTPDFKRLSVFRTVVSSGGVNAAARQLHKSPSAVTYDLQQLERQLGAVLFRQSGRRLVLTPRGRTLAASIERAYLDLQLAWDGLSEADAREPLRIACVSGFGVRSWVIVGTRKPIRPPIASVAPALPRRRLQTRRRRIDPPF